MTFKWLSQPDSLQNTHSSEFQNYAEAKEKEKKKIGKNNNKKKQKKM